MFFTQIFNASITEGYFPTKWKHSVIIPTIKTGREECNDASKYSPICLINMGSKLLEKLMIDRILFHIHSNDLFKDNQYGFMTEKGIFDAAMEVKTFIEKV